MDPVFQQLLILMVVIWTMAVLLRRIALPTINSRARAPSARSSAPEEWPGFWHSAGGNRWWSAWGCAAARR